MMLPNKEILRKAEPFYLPSVVVLVGLSAFGLGRLSATGVEWGGESAPAAYHAADETTGKYVGSKSGSKYYLPTCTGVASIKEENKVWFVTLAEAQAAGYTAAANCPGL